MRQEIYRHVVVIEHDIIRTPLQFVRAVQEDLGRNKR